MKKRSQEENVVIDNGVRGYAQMGGNVVTFEVQGISEREEIRNAEFRDIYSRYADERQAIHIGNISVPMWGDGHNLYPQEVFSAVSENKLLPEVIEKQSRFLYGKGPRLFREIIKGDGENIRRVRVPVEDPQIQNWLDSWEDKGFAPYQEYLMRMIDDFYYTETCISKYVFSKSRRIGGKEPVYALEYIGSDEARLGTRKKITNFSRITDKDCTLVILADWLFPSSNDYNIYPRFNAAKPFDNPVSISFNSKKTFTRHIYAFNRWFKGLFDWIRASNLSPKYINSFLKNALNAHIHCIIPGTWYNKHKEILEEICIKNLTGEIVQEEYRGVKLVDSQGRPYSFYETMMDDLISNELRKITSMMSGEGKNQGKLYATLKWGEEGWKFEDFPGKYKEFMDSVITYDKRADQVILAGKGISSSITNVENDGVISKSGSDVYYNYLIYVASLTMDEYFVTRDINRAIYLNFPRAKEEGIKLGFWIDIPAKMQETTPADRPQNTATPEAAVQKS